MYDLDLKLEFRIEDIDYSDFGLLKDESQKPDSSDNYPSNDISQDINVLALVKGNERYVFLYDDESRAETLRVLGRFASNPELSFTWYDAAVLSQKIRQGSLKQEMCKRSGSSGLTHDLDSLI